MRTTVLKIWTSFLENNAVFVLVQKLINLPQFKMKSCSFLFCFMIVLLSEKDWWFLDWKLIKMVKILQATFIFFQISVSTTLSTLIVCNFKLQIVASNLKVSNNWRKYRCSRSWHNILESLKYTFAEGNSNNEQPHNLCRRMLVLSLEPVYRVKLQLSATGKISNWCK